MNTDTNTEKDKNVTDIVPKHTPGPWELQILAGGHEFDIYGQSGESLALVREANESNARLIAAAPDLLDALRDCVARLAELQEKTYYPLAWPRVKAMAAINKATQAE